MKTSIPKKSPILKISADITDETLNDVVELVKFMSALFDNFGQQSKDLVSSINDLKIENK